MAWLWTIEEGVVMSDVDDTTPRRDPCKPAILRDYEAMLV